MPWSYRKHGVSSLLRMLMYCINTALLLIFLCTVQNNPPSSRVQRRRCCTLQTSQQQMSVNGRVFDSADLYVNDSAPPSTPVKSTCCTFDSPLLHRDHSHSLEPRLTLATAAAVYAVTHMLLSIMGV